MAAAHHYRKPAERHWRAAEVLFKLDTPGDQPGGKAVAGYLYGLAAEMAVKQMMCAAGFRPLPPERRREDPFFQHFPILRTQLSMCANGRRGGTLRQAALTAEHFTDWDIAMRYRDTSQIAEAAVERWRCGARQLREQMAAS